MLWCQTIRCIKYSLCNRPLAFQRIKNKTLTFDLSFYWNSFQYFSFPSPPSLPLKKIHTRPFPWRCESTHFQTFFVHPLSLVLFEMNSLRAGCFFRVRHKCQSWCLLLSKLYPLYSRQRNHTTTANTKILTPFTYQKTK